jgi:hypothetical protein
MALGAVRVEDEERRRPLRVEPLERLGLLLDVSARGNEALGDEGGDLRIGVDLGIQPSACPSHRGGAEVEEQRALTLLRLAKRRIDVSTPLDFHGDLLDDRGRSGRARALSAKKAAIRMPHHMPHQGPSPKS